MINAEENGERFDNSAIQEIGTKLDKLEKALIGAQKQIECVADKKQITNFAEIQ